MNLLLTSDGKLAFYNYNSNTLQRGGINTSPRNLRVDRQDDGSWLLSIKPGHEWIPLKSSQVCMPDSSAPKSRLLRIVSSILGSDLSDQEALLPVGEQDLDALSFLMRSSWMVPRSREVLHKGSARFMPGFRLQLGHLSLHLDAPEFPVIVQEEAMAATQRVLRSVDVLSQGWKVEHLELYAPLIYMTVFGPDTFFETMALAVQSLETLGAYTGDYLIVSDKSAEECRAFLPGIEPGRIRHALSPATSLRDITAARMNLDRQAAADCQPIVYMDTDIICDAPIQPFLVEVIGSHRIQMATEFTGHSLQEVPDHITNWFGRFLSHADHALDSRFAYCANSGIFAARHADILLGPLCTALAVWRCYGQEHDLGNLGMDFDQPFINYALQKAGVVEFALLNRVCICIYGQEPFTSEPPRGFVHFNSGVGLDKQQRMRSYLAHLLARPEMLAAE